MSQGVSTRSIIVVLCLTGTMLDSGPAMADPPGETIEAGQASTAGTEPPPSSAAPAQLEEITVQAKRLQAAGVAIEPQIGASTYTVTDEAIARQPGGANNALNQVLLQTPGVTQDALSAGGVHVRHEMQPVEFRINGIPLPMGLSFFGQGLSPRFASSFNLITGALPAEYGLATSGVIDIQTKNGLFTPGGSVTMYGGGYDTLHPSAEYGGSVNGYNYYVGSDFLSTNHGIDGVTTALTQIHDHSSQARAFAYLEKIVDAENRVTAIGGVFDGHFEIPNNPNTPLLPAYAFSTASPFRPSTRPYSTSGNTRQASSLSCRIFIPMQRPTFRDLGLHQVQHARFSARSIACRYRFQRRRPERLDHKLRERSAGRCQPQG